MSSPVVIEAGRWFLWKIIALLLVDAFSVGLLVGACL
jgi:hypothetical protein